MSKSEVLYFTIALIISVIISVIVVLSFIGFLYLVGGIK